ncbi:branched chain amino acid aminotransferase [Candidatus Roizmanbacteria bacterium CG_4_10_14_0_2_um_filter_39_13]|uniref:Branched-chain-amino-acid aminotransferase n=1 Tax=Candidatus Roizmanbacteria bacterium CG_4_10_14_0_2_um_filter_39_13 TaxID=1974825 RepID=A0A2M7TYB6_9BACT|nr:MAG: branched chain amino acid aminotransferase [Candidatus Roizmanbacteria bacterium CG_4_10_14_0_2_um_filter_39_13]
MGHLQTNALPYAFFQGKIVPVEKAQVNIQTNALQYGTGIFGGIRGYYSKKGKYISIFRLNDHMARFVNSLKILGESIEYSKEDLINITMKLMKKNSPQTDTYIRPFAYAGSLSLTPNLERDNPFYFAEYMIPLGNYLSIDKGVKVCVSSWRRISDNAIPSRAKISGGYINSALAKKEANQNGFDEAIFLNEAGNVAEGSAMNLFIVRDGVLITPSKTDDVLEGITRRSIIQFAKDLNIPVEERTIDRSELYIADEAFFCGTGAQVAWISEIDHRKVGTGRRGKITGTIQDLFFKVVRGEEDKYESWRTIITV